MSKDPYIRAIADRGYRAMRNNDGFYVVGYMTLDFPSLLQRIVDLEEKVEELEAKLKEKDNE